MGATLRCATVPRRHRARLRGRLHGSRPGRSLAEAGIAAGIAALHVLDHTVVPTRFHLGTHLASAAAVLGAARATGTTPAQLGLAPATHGPGLRLGLVSGAAVTAVVGAGALLPATRRYFLDARVLDAGPAELARRSLLEIPLGTAIYEEVLFRGVLLAFALRHLPPVPATVATSALFGLWHVFPALRDRHHHPSTRDRHPGLVVAAAVANTAAVGGVLSWQRLRTGSLVAPILTHTATNAVTYLVAAAVGRVEGARSPAGPVAGGLSAPA
jgi:membrane protease YdiL (CAAX protease family)